MFKTVLPLSAILSLRFFGLFLVLPVLSAYALQLQGATPTLIGVIVGGYALTQAIFQVPFGIMSDKLGRKPTLLIGLIIFLVGSIICAVSQDIYSLIFGRFLQGAGAIGAVIPAMISDLVNEESRGKAMVRVPTLRNITQTAPYYHNGQIATLPEAIKEMGRIQLGVDLTEKEITEIHTFLKALDGKKASIAYPMLPASNPKTPKIDVINN